MIPNFQITEHVSFYDFTNTNYSGLLKVNREECVPFLFNIRDFLQEVVEPVWRQYNRLHILSGFRCVKLNEVVGGSLTSQHLVGEALDFLIPKYTYEQLEEVLQWIIKSSKIVFGQLIKEKRKDDFWIHISQQTPKHKFEFLEIVDGKVRHRYYG